MTMKKPDRLTWIIYGGVVSAIAFSLLAVVMLALMKWLTPQSVYMSWAESPILLFLTLPCGFMFGCYIGYEVAPKTKAERTDYFKQILFCLLIVGVWNLILSSIWTKPKAEDHFWALLAWDLGPILFAAGLLKLFKRSNHKT